MSDDGSHHSISKQIDNNNDNNLNDPLLIIRDEFNLDTNQFKAIVNGFKEECEHGLNATSASGLATMIPSYVTKMPTGQEKGTYLALDLGGTNLRVSAVDLLGNGQVHVITEIRRTISDVQRTGSTTDFFDWMADAVGELLANLPPHYHQEQDDAHHNQSNHSSCHEQQPVVMGVCWSFPLDQTGICDGQILRMGKGFTLDNIDGQDLTHLFHEAFKRKNINVTVTALLNDTVGTLVAHAYSNPGACVGFIHGTGVNAAYPEKQSRIVKLASLSKNKNNNVSSRQNEKNQQEKIKGDDEEEEDENIMLVNTEIDIFGNADYLPLTRFDKALDAHHSQPGFQAYEKMMAGGYLGELVRLITIELITDYQYLFDGNIPEQLKKPWSFTTATMSDLEKVETDEEKLAIFSEWLETDCINDYVPTIEDMMRLSRICCIVSSRAATLVAAGIAAMIERQNKITKSNDPIIIGVNGSTFEKYPNMQQRVKEALRQYFGDIIFQRICLGVARDGGSIGGALVAMLYSQSANDKCSNSNSRRISDEPKIDSTCFPHFYRIKQVLKRWIKFKKFPKKNHSPVKEN